MSIKRDDPKAAAAYYRAQRKAGTWQPGFGESLLMLQSTRELEDELLRLMGAVDKELGPPPDGMPTARALDRDYLARL